MATSKQSFWRASEHQCAASSQCEEEVQSKARLTAMFVGTIPAAGPPQTCPSGLPGQRQETAILPLVFPGIFGESALPSLMLHITSSAALHQPRPGTPLLSPRTKSLGRHVCPHCGKDCLKPSVLEKHLRCHTGERPYPCTTCGISFKTQSNLYKHKRTQAHARHSSESDKGSLSSQESSGSTGDPCPETPIGVPAERMTVLELGLHNAVVVGCSIAPAIQDEVTALSSSTSAGSQQTSFLRDHETHMTSIRTPLTRQEALFSKPSGSPLSHRNNQSHDSIDSGFSDGSEHHSSSRSLPEASMERENESLPEDTPQDPRSTVSVQEKQKLEERISKLIYENSMLVEDKRLENVRPRKTVLSKQGSIDLPVPYTYKDSFHFEMRSSKHVPCPLKPDRRGAQCSLPTQHAPLTRSSSLPFAMGVRACDGTVSPSLSRRCSAGHVYPLHSPDRPIANHPSLVRQVAIDCQHGTDGSLVKRSSVSSLSSEGDGLDAGAETSPKGSYRKKTRRFDYTKWHTYKCGSFQKLYRTDSKDGPVKSRGASSEKPESNAQTEEASLNVNPQHDHRGFKNNVQYQTAKSANNDNKELMTLHGNIPPERKKICTEKEVLIPHITNPTHGSAEITTCRLLASTLSSACATNLSTMTNVQNLGSYSGFVPQLSSPSAVCLMEITGTSVTPSVPVSSSNGHEAKTSFPPKYQLKIRCSTDRTSTSFSGSTLDLKNGPETSKQDRFSKISSPPKLLVGDSYVSHEQKDVQQRAKSLSDTLHTALHSTTTITALSSQHHEVRLQSQDSRDIEAIQSTPAVLPPSTEAFSISETRQPVQNDSSASAEVIPSSSVLVPAYSRRCDVQLTGTITTSQSQSCESQATPSGKQSSLLEPSSVSRTQNTFYVQTPDLQIVMQLISDEQLAMIEPHIDFNSTDGDSVNPGVPSNQPEPSADIQVNIRSEATAFSLEQTSAESSKITVLQCKSSPSLRTTDPEVPNQTSFAMTATESADSEMVRTKISLFDRNTSSVFSAEAQHVSFSSVNAVPVMTRSAAVEDPSEIVCDTDGFSRHDTGGKKTSSFLSCSADDRKIRDKVKTWCGTISQSSNILVPQEAGCKDAPDFPTRENTETGGLSSSQESVPEEAGSGRDRRPRSDTAEMSNTCENKSQVRTSGEEVQPADTINTSLSISKAAQLLDVRASNRSEGQKLKNFDRTDKVETSSPSTCAAQAGHHLLIHPHLVSALHKGSQTTSCFLHPKPQTFLGELRMSVVGQSTSASSVELMSSSSSSPQAVPCSGHDLVPQREDDSSSDDERKLVIELE